MGVALVPAPEARIWRMQTSLHAVVVGAGQAGCVIAATLRTEGFAGRITLLGAEALAPYQRPPLSKSFLLGGLDTDALLLRPKHFFSDQAIDLRLASPVAGIDVARARLQLNDGAWLGYDLLALATGAAPRRLPEQLGGALEGVLTLRDFADAQRLGAELEPGRSMVIVGGGYIGLEVAATCVSRGMSVTVLEAAPRILQRVACAQTSEFMRQIHTARGVTIQEGCDLAGLVGDRRVRAVKLGDGRELPADFVVVAIGVVPNTTLAANAGLATDNGIAVDAELRSSAENIWSAGDCAAFEFRGRRQRIESVGNAIDMGELAARNMLGRGVAYVPRPWFWSDQYDCRLQIAGHSQGYETVHVRETGAGRSHWYYRGDELLAVDAINDSRAYVAAKRLLEMGRSPSPRIVTDPATDLKVLLRA